MGGWRDVDWNPDCGSRQNDECYQRIDLIAAAAVANEAVRHWDICDHRSITPQPGSPHTSNLNHVAWNCTDPTSVCPSVLISVSLSVWLIPFHFLLT